ncbi:MAG: cadherin repeat domain-containing protein, partial [Burkholderiales bacterium]
RFADGEVATSALFVSYAAGQSVIDLGSFGKLIAPVQVDGGKWYYYWDRSGDGTSADIGTLNGGVDYTTHDALDVIFNQDINGVVNTTVQNADGFYGTTETYRYATLNGVRLALPTVGAAVTSASFISTGVGSLYANDLHFGSNAVNQTYNDFMAIWDAYNGQSVGATGIPGIPADGGIDGNSYWTATPGQNGHDSVLLQHGSVQDYEGDATLHRVALQVVGMTGSGSTAPVVTSAATASFGEGSTVTVYKVTAIDVDGGSVRSYAIAGTDAALFDINATSGVVTFKAVPDYEAPTDAGADNVYDITVMASDGVNTSTAQAVAITVTDVVESIVPFVGQSMIDLGAYGKLIAPVQMDGGKWFYYWDRNGDGVGMSSGTPQSNLDYTTHDVLDEIFNQDINGVVNTTVQNADGSYGTTDTYRYATINSVHLALPTFGGGANATDNQFRIGTAVGDAGGRENGSNAVNETYNDMLAIWDAYNGIWQGTWNAWYNTGATVGQVMLNGTPPNWEDHYLGYATATATAYGHQYVNLNSGNFADVKGAGDLEQNYVAVQVL